MPVRPNAGEVQFAGIVAIRGRACVALEAVPTEVITHDHVIADRETFYISTNRLDDADTFVAKHDRELTQRFRLRVNVGVTDSGSDHPNQ